MGSIELKQIIRIILMSSIINKKDEKNKLKIKKPTVQVMINYASNILSFHITQFLCNYVTNSHSICKQCYKPIQPLACGLSIA